MVVNPASSSCHLVHIDPPPYPLPSSSSSSASSSFPSINLSNLSSGVSPSQQARQWSSAEIGVNWARRILLSMSCLFFITIAIVFVCSDLATPIARLLVGVSALIVVMVGVLGYQQLSSMPTLARNAQKPDETSVAAVAAAELRAFRRIGSCSVASSRGFILPSAPPLPPPPYPRRGAAVAAADASWPFSPRSSQRGSSTPPPSYFATPSSSRPGDRTSPPPRYEHSLGPSTSSVLIDCRGVWPHSFPLSRPSASMRLSHALRAARGLRRVSVPPPSSPPPPPNSSAVSSLTGFFVDVRTVSGERTTSPSTTPMSRQLVTRF